MDREGCCTVGLTADITITQIFELSNNVNQCRHASEGVRNVSEEPNASVIILLYFRNQPLIDASIINSAFFLSYRSYYFSNSNCTIGSSCIGIGQIQNSVHRATHIN